MKVSFLSPARFELDGAIRYYDHQLPGLGLRFFQEVEAAIDRIRLMPEALDQNWRANEAMPHKGVPLRFALCSGTR